MKRRRMMNDKELKPCPFCAKNDYLKLNYMYEGITQIICDASKGGCGASCGGYESLEETYTEWNTRHKPDTAISAIEALKEKEQ